MSCSWPKTDDQGHIWMRADSPRERLDSFEKRRKFLAIHADHADWSECTPFTSFAKKPFNIEELASTHKEKDRGRQRLIVINPNVRIAKQLPFLKMKLEMMRYNIRDPYGRSYKYYDDHYITLWEVTPEEVVGRWDWENELEGNPRWHEQIVLPAFQEHDRASRAVTGFGGNVNSGVFRAAGFPGFL
ncbi:hypothetical protein BDV06DRAFT_71041 [Aspergillus oleicola]